MNDGWDAAHLLCGAAVMLQWKRLISSMGDEGSANWCERISIYRLFDQLLMKDPPLLPSKLLLLRQFANSHAAASPAETSKRLPVDLHENHMEINPELLNEGSRQQGRAHIGCLSLPGVTASREASPLVSLTRRLILISRQLRSYIMVEAVNCGTDFSEDLQVKRVVHECVASKLETVPLRAQLPSFRVISLVCYTAAVKKAEKKENKKKHICRVVLRCCCSQ